MPDKLLYIIPPEDAGREVKGLLRERLGLSMGLLRSLKHVEDGITLDGVRVTVRQRVEAGQRLAVRTETREQEILPMKGEVRVVYEDGGILVVNKQPGLTVHPSRGHFTDTLANRVVWYYQSRGEPCLFRAVNRLDKGTGGLLVLAKNRYTAQQLSRRLAKGDFQRIYRAVVEGTGLTSGTVDLPIARRAGHGIMRHVAEGGERAVTHYTVLAEGNGRTLLEVRLETGRTHQIRVHMAHLGHPVTGDFMYGTELPGIEGHALFAHRLSFTHPESGQRLTLEAEVPAYFTELMETPES